MKPMREYSINALENILRQFHTTDKKEVTVTFDKTMIALFVAAFLNFFATTIYANNLVSSRIEVKEENLNSKINNLLKQNDILSKENSRFGDEQSSRDRFEDLRRSLLRNDKS